MKDYGVRDGDRNGDLSVGLILYVYSLMEIRK
jgi:hypothetical protein